jgi:hypothetical protein
MFFLFMGLWSWHELAELTGYMLDLAGLTLTKGFQCSIREGLPACFGCKFAFQQSLPLRSPRGMLGYPTEFPLLPFFLFLSSV